MSHIITFTSYAVQKLRYYYWMWRHLVLSLHLVPQNAWSFSESASNVRATVYLNSVPSTPLKVSPSPAGNLLPYGRPAHWTLLPTNQAASSVLRKPKSASFGLLQDGHQPMSGVVSCDDSHNRVKCLHHKWLMSLCSCSVRGCDYYNDRSISGEFLRYFTVHCCVV